MKIGIFHTAFIGDVVLTGLLVECLHRAGHEVVFFAKSPATQVFEHDLRIQKVVAVKKMGGVKKMLSVLRIAKQIRTEKCDVLLVPHRSLTSTLCAALSGVKTRVCFATASGAFLYTERAPFVKSAHECVRYLNLAERIVSPSILKEMVQLGRPVLTYKMQTHNDFAKKWGQLPFFAKPFFIVSPGSVWATKKYPAEQWAEVAAQLLSSHPQFYCVISGSKGDLADTQTLFAHLKKILPPEQLQRVFDSTGLFNLTEFALLIGKAQIMLSNDSSPVHFAAGFNVPTVSVFGPTVPAFGFGPTSEKKSAVVYLDENGSPLPCQPCSIHGTQICPLGHHNCMKLLKPSTVAAEVKALL